MKKHLANMITCVRIIGALVLIGIEPNTDTFLIIYGLSGLTDGLDGLVARSLHIESNLGRKLDSISDLLMYGVTMVKYWPLLEHDLIKPQLYIVMGLILSRLIIYIGYGLKYHKMLSTHTIWNKATGFLVYIYPFMMHFSFFRYYVYLALLVGAFSIADDVYHIFSSVRRG